MVCITVWPTLPGNLSQGSLMRASTIALSCRAFCCSAPTILLLPRSSHVWTSSLACGTPESRLRQAPPHLGTMPSVSWALSWHPQVCLRGTRKVQLYPEQLPCCWSEQQVSSLNMGTPSPLPTTYGRPHLALLLRLGAWISRQGHTPHSTAETGAAAKQRQPRPAGSRAQTRPPRQHTHPPQLLALLLQLGLHLAQPLLDVALSLFHLSAKNSISSARNDPVLTARGL